MAKRKRGPSKAAQRKGGRAAARSRRSPIGRRRRRSKSLSGSGKTIQQAIKKPGALTRAAGKTKSGKVNVTKVRQLAKKGGKTGQRARFYLNVLRPASRRRGR